MTHLFEGPTWTKALPLRKIDPDELGVILSDIESHMPAGHMYSDPDKVTWAHETTHGINRRLRNEHRQSAKINALYCLNNRACIIEEPPLTISQVAETIPVELRENLFHLYMVQQAHSWNNTPLYIFDEWVAYTNGAAVRYNLNLKERLGTVKAMLEFNNYALALAIMTDNSQLKNFVEWHLLRVADLYLCNLKLGNIDAVAHNLEKTIEYNKGSEFGEKVRKYLGPEFTKKILGY